ncbi:tetratricopeptide repeat protein [Streptomyces sp. NPDC002845]
MTAALDIRYQDLPPGAADLYRFLGGGLFVLDFDAALAAAVSGLSRAAACDALQVLHSARMIEAAGAAPVRGTVYRFHDAARTHAAEYFAQEAAADQGEVLRRALDYFLDTATRAERRLTPTHRPLGRDHHEPAEPVEFDDDAEALAWLESQQGNLRAGIIAAADAGLDASVWQLTHALWPLLRAHHDYTLWDETHALALGAARRCQDTAAELEILGTWAVGLRGARRYDDAAEVFDQVLRLARKSADGRAEAQALHEIGATHLAAARPEEAEPFLLQARARRFLLARLAAADSDTRNAVTYRRAVAVTDVCLGQVQLLLARPSEAVATFSSARATLLTVKDPIDAARALARLGRAHTLNGDPAQGERCGRRAITEFDGSGTPRWQAHSRELLAQTLQDTGRRDEAGALYQEAERIYTPISPPDADRVRQQLDGLSAHTTTGEDGHDGG